MPDFSNIVIQLAVAAVILMAIGITWVVSGVFTSYRRWKEKRQADLEARSRYQVHMPPSTDVDLSFDDDLETFKKNLRKNSKRFK